MTRHRRRPNSCKQKAYSLFNLAVRRLESHFRQWCGAAEGQTPHVVEIPALNSRIQDCKVSHQNWPKEKLRRSPGFSMIRAIFKLAYQSSQGTQASLWLMNAASSTESTTSSNLRSFVLASLRCVDTSGADSRKLRRKLLLTA